MPADGGVDVGGQDPHVERPEVDGDETPGAALGSQAEHASPALGEAALLLNPTEGDDCGDEILTGSLDPVGRRRAQLGRECRLVAQLRHDKFVEPDGVPFVGGQLGGEAAAALVELAGEFENGSEVAPIPGVILAVEQGSRF